MAGVFSEYHRFLAYLAQRDVHDDVFRFAHLVLEHLQPLADVGAGRRARSRRLVPLATEHLAEMPIAYAGDQRNPETGPTLERLYQLNVGPFRGFMQQETFDLSHDITLIYGANGTGKSSFCEALEVAMLGTIIEAQAKRLDQRIYCDNARLGLHRAPILSAFVAGQVDVVRPNESEYRFCFIEKNRLDDFARIAARTPGDQRQLIATLFGVDEFREFVRGFNPSLDQDLMLTGRQAAQLAERREQLADAEQTVADYPAKIAQIEVSERALAQRMRPGSTYQTCVDWLLGTPQHEGRLPDVQAQLDAPSPTIHEVTQSRLRELLGDAYRFQEQLRETLDQLAARSKDVSYANLYEAVLAFADGASACPACGTDLTTVTTDPFATAREGLEQLAELATIQQHERSLRTQHNEVIRRLWEEMGRVVAVAFKVGPEQLKSAGLPPLPETPEGDWIATWLEEDNKAWNNLLRMAEAIESADEQAREVQAQREALAQERQALDQYRLEIERLRTIRSTADGELTAARQTIAEFEEANRDLIEAVAEEVPTVEHHQRVKAAHDGFLFEIQEYLAELPGLLIQGLGEQARDLYNAFNRADPPGDLLHELRLPVVENGKIEIEFASQPGVLYDALIVLSEGHIKCVGLAILLAKNIVQRCPVVIFDDVVNAIDDEHRDGIWRTFFEDGLLDDKQVILTSHAEEFLLRIQQELGARRAAAMKRYKFLPHRGEHEIRVDSDPPTKNYVLLAQAALEEDEKREALRNARPALESLTDRVWTWLGRRADGRIELRLAGPRAPWELNNKCSKLRSSVRRIADQHDGAPDLVEALDHLLGHNGSIEWGYLNGGVHDAQRNHEFDRATVKAIVGSVTALDEALVRLRNR